MHVVFLNVTGSLGGAERVLLTLLRALRKQCPQWTCTVIAGADGPLTGAVESLGCRTEVLALSPRLHALGDWGQTNRLRLVAGLAAAVPDVLHDRLALRHALERLAPDIVHTNGFKMHLLGALACPPSAKLIWHIHDFVSPRRVMRTLLGRYARRPRAIAAISPAVAEDLCRVLPVPVLTIENAIDLDRFTAIENHSHIPVEIGFVATFARWKGQAEFLRALALLPPDLPWRAVIAGGGVYQRSASQWTQQELAVLADQAGIGGRVTFTGFLDDVVPALEKLAIVVHASTEPEPFGLSIAEAMAAGKAAITSSPNMLRDGIEGLVHRPGDVAGLAAAMERLLRDPALRARLGHAARQAALARFDPARLAQQFAALYGSVS